MVNVPERIKKALFNKGWTQKKLCAEIDVTETGFKRMIDSNSWKLETLEKISTALGVSVVYFIANDEQKLTPAGADGSYLLEHLSRLEESFNKLLEQLAEKDRQVDAMQRTIDALNRTNEILAGKSKGTPTKSRNRETVAPHIQKKLGPLVA